MELLASAVIQLAVLAVLGVLAWLGKKALTMLDSMHKKLEHLDECMDGVQAASAADREELRIHRQESEGRDRRIAQLERDNAALEAWVKGRFGLSIDAQLTQIPARGDPPP
jgi:hypothetical protein